MRMVQIAWNASDEELTKLVQIFSLDDVESLKAYLKMTRSKNGKQGLNTFYLDNKRRRNMLHFASAYSAEKCIAVLLDEPLSMDPDVLDLTGWSPLRIAENRDELHSVCQLASRSNELRHFGPQRVPVEPCTSVSTCLVWPQDALVCPFNWLDYARKFFGQNRNQADTDAPGGNEHQLLCSCSFRLLFELLLSNTEIMEVESDTDDREIENNPMGSKIWPIIPTTMLKGRSGDFFHGCQYYSALSEIFSNATDVLNDLYGEWKHSRFTETSNGELKVWRPPRLDEFCRIRIRSILVNVVRPRSVCSQNYLYPNYVRLVNSLPLPDKLKEFLLYRELWSTCKRNRNKAWILPGRKRTMQVTMKRFGPGILVGQGFIPKRKKVNRSMRRTS